VTQREQFEAAMCQLAEQPESAFEKPYDSDDVNAHWAVWQASRRTALEEALVAVEFIASRYNRHKASHPHVLGMQQGTSECFDAIRALAASDSDGGKS